MYLELNYYSDKLISIGLCPDNLSKKLLGGGSVLYIHLFFFRVSTDLVSTSERPSVYQ